jgi:uncharacterized protein YecE (DUF72 family)
MGEDEMLVEFRHRSWYEEDVRADVLSFLEEHGMSVVVVDAPKVEAKNVPPTLLALTSPTLYVRFHGRNAKTWNVRGKSAAERFDYLYTEDELREWVEPLRELSAQAENAYAVFNNNNRSPANGGFVAQAATNAQQLKRLLQEAEVPA